MKTTRFTKPQLVVLVGVTFVMSIVLRSVFDPTGWVGDGMIGGASGLVGALVALRVRR